MTVIRYILILLMLASQGVVVAQDQFTGVPKPLFQSEDILEISLESDFKAVFSNKDDSTVFPAVLKVRDNDGELRALNVELRTRGKTRRESDVCSFPPLRVDFRKKETKKTPFEGQKYLKLVTHCNRPDFYEQNTIKEYLIYKAYNVLTDSSLKVRPMMLSYVYSDKQEDTLRKFAFFIEREKHLAERLHGIEIEDERIHPNRADIDQTCLVDLFQYMIGNTDYSIYELHNIILISDSLRQRPPIPVPYDFDWSGLIDANYAVPHSLIDTRDVTDRVYRGFKKDLNIVHRSIQLFNARKQEIYRLFEDFELLDKGEKKEALRYLDTFFYIINHEKMVQTEFYDRARVVHN